MQPDPLKIGWFRQVIHPLSIDGYMATADVTVDEAIDDTGSTTATKPELPEYTPPQVTTQEEYAKSRIRDERLPPGIVRVTGSKYILR